MLRSSSTRAMVGIINLVQTVALQAGDRPASKSGGSASLAGEGRCDGAPRMRRADARRQARQHDDAKPTTLRPPSGRMLINVTALAMVSHADEACGVLFSASRAIPCPAPPP